MPKRKLRRIRQYLAGHEPPAAPLSPDIRAAVALILQPWEDDLRVLFIHRAEHPLDPWSGHIAFPGGRQEAADRDLLSTTRRETLEEVGIDLCGPESYLGRLQEIQATGHGRPLSMTISPFVYEVGPEVHPSPDPAEVQGVLWVPLGYMQRPENLRASVKRPLPSGHETRVPALVYDGRVIWGLTYRVLTSFLELIVEEPL